MAKAGRHGERRTKKKIVDGDLIQLTVGSPQRFCAYGGPAITT